MSKDIIVTINESWSLNAERKKFRSALSDHQF